MLRQVRESMLRQMLHVRIASDTQRFRLLIGPYNVPPFVGQNIISDGLTIGLLIR